jgi:hypothetical protein
MAKYKVQQRAEIWYETFVEATSPEEAQQKAWENDVLDGWEQLPETVVFQDEFWTEEQKEDN